MKNKNILIIGLVFAILNLTVAILTKNFTAIGGWLCSAVLFRGLIGDVE